MASYPRRTDSSELQMCENNVKSVLQYVCMCVWSDRNVHSIETNATCAVGRVL
jgi:hypothetical protein